MILNRCKLTINDKKATAFLNGLLVGQRRGKSGGEDFISDINKNFLFATKKAENKFFAAIYDYDKTGFDIIYAHRADIMNQDECLKIIVDNIIESLSDKASDIDISFIKCSGDEITITDFIACLERADTSFYINSSVNRILERLSMQVIQRGGLFEASAFEYSEELFENKLFSYEECLKKADKIMASDSLIEEINRIYSPENEKKFYGHPIHYYIEAGSYGAAYDIINILIPALLENKRLESRRLGSLRKISPRAYNEPCFENVFSTAINSALIVDLSGNEQIGNYASDYHYNAEMIGKKLALYGNNALFIFVDISNEIAYRDENLATIIGNGDIIKIDEGFGDKKRALDYLDDLVNKSNFASYKEEDMDKYLPDKISFSVSDVYEAFDKWYGRGLKTHAYKAYQELETVRIKASEKINKPYDELKKMIGLKDIKNVLEQIIAYSKIVKRRKELGLKETSNSRHMLFYGNPGTAKSTVAKLLGQILKEEGVLDSGHLVECGRQDLVGKYVGWTAKTVEAKFKEARGGILFIDEAYSLIEDRNSFGTEAINTIVHLMENYRDEVIVVFAGYPDKMKDFIGKNEGLASRIGFQLDFPDYNEDELMGILELMLKENEYEMNDEAKAKCLNLFKEVSNIPNFGNGRFVRNLLEQIEMKQSLRLCHLYEGKEVDKKIISQILPEDVIDDYKFLIEDSIKNKIGFIA